MSKRVTPCGLASAADVFYLEWARESVKATTPMLNDVLGKVLTLSTALVGGGLAVLDKANIHPLGKYAMLVSFALTAAACLWGLFPAGRVVWMDPDDIRAFEVEVIRRKKEALRWAAGALVVGFFAGIVGLGFGLPDAVPPPQVTGK